MYTFTEICFHSFFIRISMEKCLRFDVTVLFPAEVFFWNVPTYVDARSTPKIQQNLKFYIDETYCHHRVNQSYCIGFNSPSFDTMSLQMFDGLTRYLWVTDKPNINKASKEPSTPEIQDVESSTDDEVATEAASKEQNVLNIKRKITIVISSIVITLASVAIAMHSLALYSDQDLVVYFSTIIGVLMSLSTIRGQYILAHIDTFRCVHNKIRLQVNVMMKENNKLQRHVNALESEVSRVKNVEHELIRLTKSSEIDIKRLVTVVTENELIIKRQVELARQAFQEQLLTSVLRTDRNGDMHITDDEVDVLILRIRSQEGLHIDENKFRAHIKASKGSIWSIMNVLNQISNPTKSDNFIIQADDCILIRRTNEQ